jgi:competence protein ComGC
MYAQANRPTKGMAIASLVLGIISIPTLGLIFVGGLLGIILGVIALGKIKSDPAHYAGKGLAIAGIVTSSLSILIAIPGIAAIAIPNLTRSQQAAREISALHEVKTIGQAQVLYSLSKGDGKFTDLRTLGAEGLIDATLATGEENGYLFTSEPVVVSGLSPMFDTTAKPTQAGTFGTGNRSFGSNEILVVYEAEGSVDLKGTPSNRVPSGGKLID